MSGKHAKVKITRVGSETPNLRERMHIRKTWRELGRSAIALSTSANRPKGRHAAPAPYTLRSALTEVFTPAAPGRHALRKAQPVRRNNETINGRENMRHSRVARRVGRVALALGLTLGITGGAQALDTGRPTMNMASSVAPAQGEAEMQTSQPTNEQATAFRAEQNENKTLHANPKPKSEHEVHSLPSLPDKTVSFLEKQDLAKRFKANESRYKYAEEKTGVPKHVLAAIHYREAGPSMPSNVTLLDGEPLSNGGSNSVDGIYIDPDANKDAVNAASLFKDLSKEVYNVDVTKPDLTPEEWTKAFTAYNRGYLYKKHGVSPDQSPYAMNGLDEEHQDMNWPGGDADPGRSTRGGGKDGNPVGAVPAMIYFEELSKNSDVAESTEKIEATETAEVPSNE